MPVTPDSSSAIEGQESQGQTEAAEEISQAKPETAMSWPRVIPRP